MIVVDSGVLAAFWLPGDWAEFAEATKARDAVWAAPVGWRAEFRNVLAGYVRQRRLTAAEANAAYRNAQKDLGAQEYEVPTERILELAQAAHCSAYGCEYVALAQDLGVPLVSTDPALLREFPGTAVALEEFAKAK